MPSTNGHEIFMWRPWFPKGTYSYLLKRFLTERNVYDVIINTEKKLEKYLGAKYVILMPSGTASIYAVIKALLPNGPGEILLPSLICETVPYAIQATGKKPHFIDINPRTFNMDVKILNNEISNITEAVLAVHQFGLPCEIEAISEVARENNLLLIEDAAQIFGGSIHGRKCGTIGDVGILSFNNKMLDACGGGAVVTENKSYFNKIKNFRDEYFKISRRGFASDVLRCWLLSRYPKLAMNIAEWKSKKNEVSIPQELNIITPLLVDYQIPFANLIKEGRIEKFNLYDQFLKDGKIKKPIFLDGSTCTFYTIQIENGCRKWLRERLIEEGIHTEILAEDMHGKFGLKPYLPNTYITLQEMLSFPTDMNLKRDDIEYISERISNILMEAKL